MAAARARLRHQALPHRQAIPRTILLFTRPKNGCLFDGASLTWLGAGNISVDPVKFHVDQNSMRIVRHCLVTGFLAASLYSPACAEMPGQEEPQQAPSVKFAPPDVTDIPNDENRNHILLGRRLLAQTKKLLPDNVGNGLNCTNCHLGEGRVAPAFPASASQPVLTG